MAQTDLKYTGVPKGRNGKDLSPVFGGKMHRKTGDAEADKATADMTKEMENLPHRIGRTREEWQRH